MNFSSIIRAITVGQACKRPSWSGYVKKIAPASGEKMPSPLSTVDVAYKLVFKQRDNDEFTYCVDANGNIIYKAGSTGEPANTLALDGQLLAGLMATDWISGTPSDFDSASGGTSVW